MFSRVGRRVKEGIANNDWNFKNFSQAINNAVSLKTLYITWGRIDVLHQIGELTNDEFNMLLRMYHTKKDQLTF